jgi:DNA-binding LytR/AlgR family response regulator
MAKEKIVVIEDDKEILRDIEILLVEENYVVATAKNGKEGIEVIRKEKPDLVLCDILMPDIDGYGVLAEIQKDKLTRTIPFIFVTAKVERQDVRKGMQLGADDYIFKPFSADELLSAINMRLKKRNILIADIENELPKSKDFKKLEMTGKILLKIGGYPKFFKVSDLVYISAERQYTSLWVQSGKSVLVRKSVNAWEEILPGEYFLRIHRSTIINTEYISKIEKWHNASYLMYLREIKEPFNISKRYATRLRQTHL